jgi:CelD/BcsL family acetyltransferase involved in cellulose biosynthesis
MLIPAVETLATNLDLHFVLIYAPDVLHPLGPKILCGFFPLERSRHYKKLPVSVFRFWKHAYCFLCTPLLKADYERQTLEAFFDWLESAESSAQLMELNHIAADGAFHKLLIDELNERARLSFVEERYNRALFKPNTSEGISGRHKKELRRQQNRLAEEGALEYAALEDEAEVEEWITNFLQLEASGWKGQQASAFASHEASRKLLETVVKEAFQNGQLMMIALRLNGKPIAMKCNFLTAGGGSFAFKIAFDEDYARYSPGVLLELENMRRVNVMPLVEWMDSCAVSQHFMINRLWAGRRSIETILVSTGKRPADFLVSALPMIRWFKRRISRNRNKQ